MHFIRVMRDKGWASADRTFIQMLDLVKDMKEELESGR
jgi:hypothetical protein